MLGQIKQYATPDRAKAGPMGWERNGIGVGRKGEQTGFTDTVFRDIARLRFDNQKPTFTKIKTLRIKYL